MKYQLNINGKTILLTHLQLEVLLGAVQDADQLGEKHVGNNNGSQGYQNAYVPTIETKHPQEWLQVMVVPDDYIETVKLSMKLTDIS